MLVRAALNTPPKLMKDVPRKQPASKTGAKRTGKAPR